MRDRGAPGGEQRDVGVGQLHGVRGEHPAVRARRAGPAGPAPTRARPAAGRPPARSPRRGCAPVRPAPWRARRPRPAPRAAGCRPRAGRSPARSARPARSAARARRSGRETASRICCQRPSRSQPGAAMMPGVSSTREPTAVTASITSSVKKYISTLVVQPRAEQLHAAGGHARAHVRSGQPAFGRPHHLVQPAQQRQVAAQPAQRDHRGVRVRVDQPGQQRAGQLADRRASSAARPTAGRRSRSGRPR